MKLLIHDLTTDAFNSLSLGISEEVKVISDDGTIKNCIGCFGCWIKTPGACILKDHYSDMGELIGKCDEIIVISRCTYGWYSPFIKNVFDRSISYIHPYFVIRNNEMHHKRRYDNQFNLKIYFYGDISNQEMKTAEKMVDANIINLNCKLNKLEFLKDYSSLEGIKL